MKEKIMENGRERIRCKNEGPLKSYYKIKQKIWVLFKSIILNSSLNYLIVYIIHIFSVDIRDKTIPCCVTRVHLSSNAWPSVTNQHHNTWIWFTQSSKFIKKQFRTDKIYATMYFFSITSKALANICYFTRRTNTARDCVTQAAVIQHIDRESCFNNKIRS